MFENLQVPAPPVCPRVALVPAQKVDSCEDGLWTAVAAPVVCVNYSLDMQACMFGGEGEKRS